MPITAEQVEERRSAVGSSDAPAVAGVDPYRTSHDVWLEKTAGVEDLAKREAVEIGNEFERPLLWWAARELGVEIEMNVRRVHPERVFLAANLDALVVGRPVGIEAKTTSLAEEYGDEGTDQVPDRVLVQTAHQMAVAELEVVWVPVLMARHDRLHRALYRVDRNESLIRAVVNLGVGFWENHVLPGVPPADTSPSLDVLKRLRRRPGSTAIVAPQLVEAFEVAQAARKEAQAEEDAARSNLLSALGEAEAADYGDPDTWYTYLEQTRTSVDGRSLRLRYPEVYEEMKRTTSFRVLRKSKRRGR